MSAPIASQKKRQKESDGSLWRRAIPRSISRLSPPLICVLTVLESVPNSYVRTKVLVADAIAMSCQLVVDALLATGRFDAAAATKPEEVVLALDRGRFDVMVIATSFSPDSFEGLRF